MKNIIESSGCPHILYLFKSKYTLHFVSFPFTRAFFLFFSYLVSLSIFTDVIGDTLIFLIIFYGQLLFTLITRCLDIGGRRRCYMFRLAYSVRFARAHLIELFRRSASSTSRRPYTCSSRLLLDFCLGDEAPRESYLISSRFLLQTNDSQNVSRQWK